MLKHIVFLAILVMGSYLYWTERVITYGPGVVAPAEPSQRPAFGIKDVHYKNYNIKPLAKFNMEARVLSKKRYSSGRLAEIAPLDLVMGWGPMSDERNLNEILITQSDRYFNWQMTKYPIPLHQMVSHTANIHIVPSTPEIEKKLWDIRKGHILKLKGNLVKISSNDDGWTIKSSLKRSDYGDKASEILWVKELKITQ